MKGTMLKLCSIVLTIVLLVNMLPLQVFATEVASAEQNVSLQPEQELSVTKEPETVVAKELPGKRTEYSKEFLLGSGVHMATVYPQAVHYETEDGWQEIDNTLKLSTDGSYTNTAGIWKVRFPGQMNSNKAVSITKNGYTLSFRMAGKLQDGGLAVAAVEKATAEKFTLTESRTAPAAVKRIDLTPELEQAQYPETVPQKLRSRIEYGEVFQGTDVIYDLNSSQVKESVVLESYDSTLRGYRYILETGELIPELRDGGDIVFYNKEKTEIVLIMPAPYLIDANMEYNYDVAVSLQGKGGTYTLTYTLPTDWLAEEARAWPVILDPVVNGDTKRANIQDVSVCTEKTLTNTAGMIYVGHSTKNGIYRTFMRFEELPPLTSSDVILGATISVYKYATTGTNRQINVHKVTEDWEFDGLNWTNKPDYDTTIEDYVIAKNEGYYTWNITDAARGWYAGENTGVMFKYPDDLENVTTNNYLQFKSVDYAAQRPQLTILFRNNNGLESYWDYSSASAGRAGTGYINRFTGNLTWIRSDIGFGGNRMPVSINHVYNLNDSTKPSDSNNANDTAGNYFGLGNGWRTNFHQRVYQWDVDDTYYVWEDADGTDHYFKKSATSTYKDEDGLELTLKTNGSGTGKYTITDKYGNVSYFDTNGRLTKQSNNQATKSHITISYTTDTGPLIKQITDGLGRKYIFTYNSSNLLSKIGYQATGSTDISYVNFTYSGTKLTKVTDKDGKSSSYTYSGNLLKTASDVDGYKLTYTYTSPAKTWQPYRVTAVQESHNNITAGKLTFTYNHNETVIKDQKNKVEIYQFNDYGNTVSIRDDQGKAQFNRYALNNADETANNTNATKKNNQLSQSSKLQYTVANDLPYNSFEAGNNWTASATSLTLTRTTEAAYRGNYALKMTNSSTGNVSAKSATYAVAAGETVTFSTYVKSVDAAGFIALQCGSTTQNGASFAAGVNWKRLQITYTNNTTASVNVICHVYLKTQGAAYIDCVQLEKNTAAGRLNLLENGDFYHTPSSFPSSWTGNGTGSGDVAATPSPGAPGMHAKAFKLTGSATAVKRIYQTVNISGAASDIYVIAGWAKGNSAPLRDNRKFSLIATFNNTDGTTTKSEVDFNPDTENWQYAAMPIKSKKAYSSIKFEIAYDYNINTVYFDGIQLYKERLGFTYDYDENGNILGIKNVQGKVTKYEYTSNNLTKEILPTGAEMTYTYDSYHNVKTATTELGDEYTFTYDAYGNNTAVSITDAENNITMTSTATYTDNGNYLQTATDTAGNTTTYAYNANTGVLESVKYPTDTDTTKTVYTYDEMYRMTKAQETVSSPYHTTAGTQHTQQADYAYENDNLKTITTPGATYQFTYGDFGVRTGVSVGGQSLAAYTYSADGNHYLNRLDYGNGDSVNYTYNKDGSLATQTYEDGDKVAYWYDNDGNQSIVKDQATGRTGKYYYDITGRLTSYSESSTGHSVSVSYAYDSVNRVTTVNEKTDGVTRAVTHTYDGDNRVSVYKKGNLSQNYTYDAFGRNSKKVVKNGSTTLLTTTYAFKTVNSKATGQVGTMRNLAAGYDVSYTYTYDGNGNILSVSDGTHTTTYQYDESNQLVRENNQKGGYTYTWVYDRAGNILSRTEYAYTADTLGTPTETVAYTYGNSNWGDQLTAMGDRAFTYDQIGNVLNDGKRTYTWEHGRQLATLTQNGATWTNTYDVNGLRMKRTDGTNTYQYYYIDGNLVSMTYNGSRLYFAYTPDGLPYGVEYGGAQYVYALNLQGDVVAFLDASGAKVVEYTYDAWGNILSVTGSMADTLGQINPLRYRGYVYDNETELYYVSSRYYDPEIGRWISPEPNVDLGEFDEDAGLLGYNVYAYCVNNPVNNFDPDGEAVANIVGGVVGGVAGAALGILLAKKLGLKGWKKTALIAAATVGGAALGAFLGPYVAKLAKSIGTTVKAAAKTVARKAPKSLCFVAGTLVEAQDGHKPIETVKVGDYVYAENPETGEKALKQVVQTFVNQTEELVHIRVDGQIISATPSHPFYLPEKGWIEAIDLNVDDKLILRSGEIVCVEEIQLQILKKPVTVYNFEVEEFHTYYVTSSSILVHNLCAKEFIRSPKNSKQVLSYLKKQGFKTVSQNGSHIKLVSGSKTVIVPNHGGKDIAIGTLKSIMKQAGLY